MTKNNFILSGLAQQTINPWFLTGFTDAEGCFTIGLYRNPKHQTGWSFRAIFSISLHKKDKTLLENIQSYFGVGSISTKHGPQSIIYYVQSIKDLINVIIPHFDSYPLITQKWSDYQLFKQALELIERKEHLTQQGLEKLVTIKASMNKGISDELKAAFPGVIPVERPSVDDILIRDPYWLAGFTSGEGCFMVGVRKDNNYSIGFQVELVFILTQHSRDEQLMNSLTEYLNCGNLHKKREVFEYRIRKFSDLTEKVIPLFNKYPVIGVKSKDFADFCRVAELMKNKAHLTKEGLNKIRKIKAGMNTGRI